MVNQNQAADLGLTQKQPNITISGFVLRLTPFFARYPFLILIIAIALIFEASIHAAIPLCFKFIIDFALIGPDKVVEVANPVEMQHLKLILILLGIGVVMVTFVGIGRLYLEQSMIASVIRDIRLRLFDHLQRLSLSFYVKRQMGDLISRFSGDLVTIETTLIGAVAWVIIPAIHVVMGTCVLFYLNWQLALISLLIWPLCLFVPNIFAKSATKASYNKKKDEAQTIASLQENLDSRSVIRAFRLETWAHNIFNQKNLKLCASTRIYGFYSALIEHISIMGLIILQVIVLGIGAYMVYKGSITIGDLAAFQTMFLGMSTYLSYIPQYVPNVIQAAGSMERIEEIIREVPEVADAPNAIKLPSFNKEIEFNNVNFNYDTGTKILDDVSLKIKHNEKVAFVGSSGSGKSTILNLVMRFYDPQQGTVTIDGVDIKTVTQESLRAKMGVVFQESFLFNMTIKENLLLAKPDATDLEIEEAAKGAEIHNTIMEMPQGYNTMVGERGGTLSGGQRQRLAIARALLNKPEILILDEATSALDPVTEQAINATLEQVGKSRTVLMVSHRLASVQKMDWIVVLDHGRICEQGTHNELLQKNGVYAKLWQKQGGFILSDDGLDAKVTIERLREYPLFTKLSETDIHKLANLFTTINISADETLVTQGVNEEYFYIIVRGKVKVEKQDQETTYLTDGDYFGETTLFVDIPAIATITTLEPCILLKLESVLFTKFIQKTPGLHRELREFLTAD